MGWARPETVNAGWREAKRGSDFGIVRGGHSRSQVEGADK